MQYFALIDESASDDCYRVGTLVIHESRQKDLRDGLNQVMVEAEKAYGIPSDVELHAHRMFHGLEEWKLLYPRQRIAVYSNALEVVADVAEAIYIRGVNIPAHKKRYNGRYDPYEAALMYSLRNVNRWLERKPTYSFASVYADDCRFNTAAKIWLENAQSVGTWGANSTKLECIDGIDFVDSKKYRQIQAIDLVTYMKTRITSVVDPDPREVRANEKLWSIIKGRITYEHVWVP